MTRIARRGGAAEKTSRATKGIYSVLITGVGGSGTNLVQAALARWFDIEVGHEYAEGAGAASWIHAVNDVVVGQPYPFPRAGIYKSVGFLPDETPRFRTVIHQVRRRRRCDAPAFYHAAPN
jgi:hypothetical protein